LKKFILHIIILLAVCSSASAQTTKGKEFWFSYIANLIEAQPQVYISSEQNASGTVEIPGVGWTQNFNVAAGTTALVTLPLSAIVPYSNGLHNLAVHLEACDSVTVYAVFPGAYSSDASVVFPKSSLGSDYTVLNMTGSPQDWGDAVQIVATENNTVIQITPRVTTDGGQAAGVPFTVTLNEGQVYQLTHLASNADLTGTRIVGMNSDECKPFGVFSGAQCINIGNCTACDQIYDMLIPNSNLGVNYGLIPLAQKGQTVYRVMAITDGTQVFVDGNPIATLNAGQFQQFNNNTYSYLTATNPVMVAQFARGVSCDQTGDPFKVSLFPIEQSINGITFNAFQTPIVNNYWINVVSATASVADVTLDGANISAQFTPFPANNTYSYARINIPAGDHRLNSTGGVLATIYGWGSAESFGYCAGASMKDLTNDFSIESSPACSGEDITFTAVSDPTTINYVWDFGDGSPLQNGLSVTHSYTLNDSYMVTLTKQKSNQCDIKIEKPVDIIDPPIQIIQNDTALCLGQYIDLIVPVNTPFLIPRVNGCGDTISVEIIMQYDSIYWSTGAVGDSIRVTPTTDTVIYVYGEKFDSDCIARDSIVISVIDITADFSVSDVCLLDSVCLQDLSLSTSPFTTSTFYLNDSLLVSGQSDFCFRHTSAGMFDVKLVLSHPVGCADSIQKQLEIYTHPTVDFSLADACDTDSVLFSSTTNGNGYAIDTYVWDFTSDGVFDATTPNTGHIYPSEGTYLVTFIAVNEHGCSDTLQQQIIVNPLPVALFNATEVCFNDSTTFTDLSTITTDSITEWSWDFDDLLTSAVPSPMHLYANDGTYNVTLTVTSVHGCSDAITQVVTVHPLPVADFTFANVCATDAASFLNQSTGASIYAWDFGDGNNSTLENPINIFINAADYDVELIVTSAAGCVDTNVQTITVHPLPMAGFINDTVCARLATSFTDTSIVASGNIVGWAWDFGDGGTSTTQNPTHIFMVGGIYTVSLVVMTDEDCADLITRTVVVHAKPDAEFAATNECLHDANQFVDASTVAAGTQITQWDWDMGDNIGTSTAQDTSYVYAQSGTYIVTLMIETDRGCRDTVTHTAEVFDLPVASFILNDVCYYDPAIITNTSTIASGTIDQNLWNLGDGTIGDFLNPAPHTYPLFGVYDVELITVSDHGCRDTLVRPIEIFAVPVADFTFDTVCFPLQTTFTDLSTIAGADVIDQWNWNFGDNTSDLVNQSPTHGYDVWGDYTVTLTVTSENGCAHTMVNGPARVHPQPNAVFSNAIANCHQDSTYFQDLSTLDNYPLDSIATWRWSFGDGSISNLPDPVHLYANEGYQSVGLAVVSNHGCGDTVAFPVEIYPLPRVAFAADTTRGCQPFRAQFLDQSTIPHPYNLSRWEWSFGDSSDAVSAQFPTHIYNTDSLGPLDEGVFTVTLTVTSGNGCVSSVTYDDYMTEYPRPQAWFDVDPKRAELLYARLQVTDLSTPNVTEWTYHMGEGTMYYVPNPLHAYSDTGLFTITQYVATQYGCLDTAEFTIIVDPEFYFYIPNTFTPNQDGDNETFFGTGVGVIDYQMFIFDRWGSQVFESGAMSLHWDGTKNGHAVQQGVYAYLFKILDVKGRSHEYVGHVNLIR